MVEQHQGPGRARGAGIEQTRGDLAPVRRGNRQVAHHRDLADRQLAEPDRVAGDLARLFGRAFVQPRAGCSIDHVEEVADVLAAIWRGHGWSFLPRDSYASSSNSSPGSICCTSSIIRIMS